MKCSRLNPNKACGTDSITTRELELGQQSICISINSIANKALETRTYPGKWKVSRVNAAFKKGISKDRGNYRPLSLLSVSSKLVEDVIGTGLDEDIAEIETATSNQWGYKKGISSETLLLYLTEKWKFALADKKVIGALFIDLRKAFYTVCYGILNHKFHAMGVSGAIKELLMNYLKDRSQYVQVNGEKSELRAVDTGVPQGSILGPHLFAIYVNVFPTAVQVGELHMYADDTTPFAIANTVDKAIIT